MYKLIVLTEYGYEFPVPIKYYAILHVDSGLRTISYSYDVNISFKEAIEGSFLTEHRAVDGWVAGWEIVVEADSIEELKLCVPWLFL